MRFSVAGVPLNIAIDHLVIAGWTGRDDGAVARHVAELAALGVAPPSATPLYYRVSAALLTTAPRIETVGEASSGEVEPMVVQAGRQRFLGLGSDHTDRKLEAHSVAFSKQVCAKPCAVDLWPWEDVADRLETLRLESRIRIGNDWEPYQDGTLAAILPLEELIAGSGLEGLARDGAAAMMCGTFAARGGVRPARRFQMRLTDPATGKAIDHEYRTEALPKIA